MRSHSWQGVVGNIRFSIHSSLLMAPLLLLGCGSSGWKEYKSPDGAFTVQMPGSPTVKQMEDGWQEISSNVAEEKALLSIRFKDFQQSYRSRSSNA